MTSSYRLLSVSVLLLPREIPWRMITSWALVCSGVGLASLSQVDKMNISCCCLGKCLLGPSEKLRSPSGADGMG